MNNELYEKLNKINSITEGLEKSLRAILKVYNDSAAGLPPATEDLDEGLWLFQTYLQEVIKLHRENFRTAAWFAKDEEQAQDTFKRYIVREKEVTNALKTSASDREKITVLDNVVDLIHHDTYALEHLTGPGTEGDGHRKGKIIKPIALQLITLLKKLGKFPGSSGDQII